MTKGVQQFTLIANQAVPLAANWWAGLGGPGHPARPRQDIHITGTWDSAVATLQYSVDGGTTWVDVPADKEANLVTLSANGIMCCKQRWPLLGIKLASAGGSCSLTIQVV